MLAGCQHGADGFNDGSSNDEAPDVAMVRKLMEGLGAVDARSEQKIEYAPRAPLAMPTKMTDLPQPEEKKEIANWPEQGETDLQRIQQAYRETRDIDERAAAATSTSRAASRSSPPAARTATSSRKSSWRTGSKTRA